MLFIECRVIDCISHKLKLWQRTLYKYNSVKKCESLGLSVAIRKKHLLLSANCTEPTLAALKEVKKISPSPTSRKLPKLLKLKYHNSSLVLISKVAYLDAF